jgi:hypothetical protein
MDRMARLINIFPNIGIKQSLYVLFFTLSLNSCFNMDRVPEFKVIIDKGLKDKIQLICMVDSIYNNLHYEDICKEVGHSGEIKFMEFGNGSKISIKFKDSTEYLSNYIELGESFTYKISRENGHIKIVPYEESRFLGCILLVLIAFVVSWIAKIPVAMLIMKPDDKKQFLITGSIYTLIYLVSFLAIAMAIPFFLIFFYLIMAVTDYLNYSKMEESTVFKSVLASLVSNILFFTIGQFVITFAAMILI